MKKSHFILISLLFVSMIMLLLKCDLPFGGTRLGGSQLCLSGKVIDQKGNPIVGATVSFGGSKSEPIETLKGGEFRICTDRSKRYVLNVTKLGFGFVSKIYTETPSSITITMENATVVENLDPLDFIKITDVVPNTNAPATPNVSHISSVLDTLPFVYDAKGSLIGFGAPPEIQETYEAVEQFQPQQTGATIEVEPDALEEVPTTVGGAFFQKGETGKVTGSISTVDIYSPDGMPGDNTTRMRNGEQGYMLTYGAADVNFYRNGIPLQLKKGKLARLTIPVDTLALIYRQKLPQTMPLLIYNKEGGVWERDGENVAELNEKRTAYIARISHFSVFNMDEEFAAGVAACYKLCSNTAPAGARIEITGDNPGHIKDLLFGTSICGSSGVAVGCATGETAYAINYLKPNKATGVRLFDGASNIISSIVLLSGPPGTPHETNCSSNYNGCNSMIPLNWSTPCYQNVDGSLDGPVLAIKRVGDDFTFAWIYVDPLSSGTPITNPADINYKVEYLVVTNQNISPNMTEAAWTDVPFLPSTSVFNTSWKVSPAVINLPLTTTNPILFRVIYRTTLSGSYTSGAVRLLNPLTVAPTSQFETDYMAIQSACDNIGQPIL